MEMGDHRTLAIAHCVGDLLLMATSRTIGNISSSVQHFRDMVGYSHSFLSAISSWLDTLITLQGLSQVGPNFQVLGFFVDKVTFLKTKPLGRKDLCLTLWL